MKNNSFNDVIKAPVEDRRDLFLATATRLGVPLQNIEKMLGSRSTVQYQETRRAQTPI